MEKIIELNGIDITSFLGPQDQNIKLIEDAFASKIIVRDNRIKVLGKRDNVHLSLTAIDSITSALNIKGSLTRKDVSSLLNIISHCIRERSTAILTIVLSLYFYSSLYSYSSQMYSSTVICILSIRAVIL